MGFPDGAVVKNLPASAGDARKLGFDPWVGKIPWKRMATRSSFLPGKSHGQRTQSMGSQRVGHN